MHFFACGCPVLPVPFVESTLIFKQCVFSILADVTFGRSERSPHIGKKEEGQMQSRKKRERN